MPQDANTSRGRRIALGHNRAMSLPLPASPSAPSAESAQSAQSARPTPLHAKLLAHLAALEHQLLERQTPARLLLLAALAGEHVLLIGPPGTAKSELARRLHRAFAGARYFERLLTRFSTPEELFGPLSLKALEDDRYERLIDGYLPTAGIAFLDEVFKANSAILNALLTLLNEREFDNGAARLATPLISVIGASNEAPADDSLLAFHDRFLLRVPVAWVSDAHFGALLRLDDGAALPLPTPITQDERSEVIAASAGVALSDEALAALVALRGFVAAQGWPMSDRRWRQLLKLMRCAAAAEGRAEIDALDLWLVPYVAGPDSAAVASLNAWLAEHVVRATPQDAPWLGHAVMAFEKQLDLEQRLPAEDGKDDAGKLALARALGAYDSGASGGDADSGAGGSDNPGMLRMVSATLEDKLRRRFSSVHVAARLAQIDEVVARAAQARAPVAAAHDALQSRLAGRLWLPPDLARQWLAAHRQTLALLDAYLSRLHTCREGFAALPIQAEAAAPTTP